MQVSNITYQVELLADCLDEMKPLLENHWEEIALNKDKIKLNPDYDKYLEIEKLGMVHVVTARDSLRMIGYFISIVSPHMHYSDHIYAVNDILFISPEYRRGEVAAGMFTFAEDALKNEGVSVITFSMKTDYPFDELAVYLGYRKVEYVYSKFVG